MISRGQRAEGNMAQDNTENLGFAKQQERLSEDAIFALVQAQSFPTIGAIKARYYRRVSWEILADRLQRRFERAAGEAKGAMPWERLYVLQDDASRSVRLFFGNHPVPGIIKDDIESGASLVVSQESRGGVAVLFFPFESNNIRMNKPKLIWAVYDGPQQIHERAIRRMLRDFLAYGRATSALMWPNRADRKRIERLEHRSRVFEGGVELTGLHWAAVATLAMGSITTGALIVVWIITAKGDWEPWVGLVALVTGWVAAWVQRSQQARDRMMSKAMEIEKIEKDERDRRLVRMKDDEASKAS
jgi:hypothetical protein